MKILLYSEPTTIINSPYPQSVVLKNHLYDWIAKHLINIPDVEIKMVVPELVYIQNNIFKHINNIDLIEFKDSFLRYSRMQRLSMKCL